MVDLEAYVEVAVVGDGVAVGVEDGGVPVAEGFVTGFVVVGEADVAAAGHVEFDVLASEDEEGDFGADAVVLLTVFGEV